MTESTASSSLRRMIKLLPEHLIDQIKAGEIVERPALALKEVIENSLDAGAKKIDIHIVNNGLDLIHVEDDGEGMLPQDLVQAFYRHTTSKLDSFEHLYRLPTYGFRGEALAGIASISRVTCTSTPKEDLNRGAMLKVAGGLQEKPTPYYSGQSGTSLYIRDLFYNTPVRLKFIKSKVSERSAIKRIIWSFVLANPNVSFSIKWDAREKTIFPALESKNRWSERVSQVFFNKKNELLSFEQSYEEYRVTGFLSFFNSKGYTGKQHFLIVNKRLIQDQGLHRMILRKMEHFWTSGPGHYSIFIDVPKEEVDVNIHPNKTQVKFFQAAKLFSLVAAALEKALENKAVPKIEGKKEDLLFSRESLLKENTQETMDLEGPAFGKKYIKISGNSLVRLSSTYYLLQREEGSQLLHGGRLATNFLIRGLSGETPKEEDLLPLLISGPFPYEHISSQGILFFKEMGFGLEKIDQQTITLCTIPKWCEGLQVSIFIPLFLKWAKTNSFDKSLFLEYLDSYDFKLPESTLTSGLLPLLQDFSREELEELGITVSFGEAQFDKFFGPKCF